MSPWSKRRLSPILYFDCDNGGIYREKPIMLGIYAAP